MSQCTRQVHRQNISRLRIAGVCPKIIQGPQAARINATCCVPKGEGLPLWAVISMTVDSAASISTLKKAIWKRTSRQMAGVRLDDELGKGCRGSPFRSNLVEFGWRSSSSFPISVVTDARSLSLAHLSELTASLSLRSSGIA